MEKVTFGDNIPGFEIGDKSAPAVIVLQEWWGANDTIKAKAETIHKKGGYRCLIPDLYKGKIGVDAEEASHLMNNLDWKVAIAEMSAAVAYLQETGSPKVGAVGFCMGGALALCAAQHAGVACAVPFYGVPGEELCQLEKITIPVEGHTGEADALKGFSDPEHMKASMAKIPGATFYTYPGCGHGFLNASIGPVGEAQMKLIGANAADIPAEQCELAWGRAFSFLEKHLK